MSAFLWTPTLAVGLSTRLGGGFLEAENVGVSHTPESEDRTTYPTFPFAHPTGTSTVVAPSLPRTASYEASGSHFPSA